MLNVVRRSQMIGLRAVDRTTATNFNTIEEVWVDDTGRAAYLAGTQGYTPLEQVEVIEPDAVLTYSRTVVEPPANLRPLHRLAVRSPNTDSSGWVEDFLFDWETREIAAYILGGDIATPFGERAVLFPEDVAAINSEVIILQDGASERLKSESEGLKGFLSEKSQQVKTLVNAMNSRLRSLISPGDKPDVVRVKIKQVSDELEASGQHNKNALAEAREFLQDKWESLQHSASRAKARVKLVLDSAWTQIARKK
ncbi:MAG: hypothetical protein RLP02_31785 [Coleofasciculus sp. C2-GNP5-27]|uniref:photosystem reaction center subunit H n=1 Tax=Coleofasciculus sp. B1-GNL1-01 TaxID=3068484 RepID=UPI0032F4EFBF